MWCCAAALVRRLVALDGAVALAASGGCDALVAATTGPAAAAASPLAGFEAAAAGLGGASPRTTGSSNARINGVSLHHAACIDCCAAVLQLLQLEASVNIRQAIIFFQVPKTTK